MSLYFSDRKYYDKAMEIAAFPPQSRHTAKEAFCLLLRGCSEMQLHNLCEMLHEKHREMSIESCYAETQNSESDMLDEIICTAYECIASGKALGTEIVNGKHNSSDWIGHSLLEGRLCAELAELSGLDGEYAYILGVLHDYGRREKHSFEHTIRGFELLNDIGWETEAIGCLTHSFLAGGRCTNCETAEPGFYVDAEGTACWEEGTKLDDIGVFLEAHTHSAYDRILNLADLMATSHAVVSPSERLRDILTRRVVDDRNHWYFLAEFTNTLNDFSSVFCGEKAAEHIKASENVSHDELKAAFEDASQKFYMLYLNSRK